MKLYCFINKYSDVVAYVGLGLGLLFIIDYVVPPLIYGVYRNIFEFILGLITIVLSFILILMGEHFKSKKEGE